MAETAPGPGEPPVVAEASNAQTAAAPKAREQQIDPWSVSAATDEHGNALAFDYEAISRKWNTTLINDALLERFERLTGHKPHRWLRRGLYFSHRDLDRILTCYERGERFMLYTGRGPSSGSMHIGHTIPFEFTKWLQDVFDVPLVIMLTDDEKFLFKDGLTVDDVRKFAEENAKDILAIGFDVKKTFVFTDFGYVGGHLYQNAIEFSRLLPFNQVRGAFGFDNSTNIGRIFFPAVQCVAAFATSFPEIWGDNPESARVKKTASIPCLIPCAIDQDPYFRLLRENCQRMKQPSPKPALIHCKFLTALQGAGGKMSASDPNSAIYMSDTKNQVKNKINKYAFSGGGATAEEHREKGGNPDVDVPYQYLTYFLEDDVELEQIRASYVKGELLTGEMKQKTIAIMQEYVDAFQARRAKVTTELLKEYMTPRKLQWKGNPNPNPDAKHPVPGAAAAGTTTAAAAAAAAAGSSADTTTATTTMTTPPVLAKLAELRAAETGDPRAPAPPAVVTPAANGALAAPSQTLAPPREEAEEEEEAEDEDQLRPMSLQRVKTGQESPAVERRPQRPGLPGRSSTTYGVSGLSQYGDSLSELIYPSKKKAQA